MVATAKSAELLDALTSKATALEKLKAKLGIGSTTLSAFVALIDSEIEEDDTALLQVIKYDHLRLYYVCVLSLFYEIDRQT